MVIMAEGNVSKSKKKLEALQQELDAENKALLIAKELRLLEEP